MSSEMKTNIFKALYGSLLGGAVGDAYGLPFEGMRPQRIAKIFSPEQRYHLIPLIHGGMVSDDTEHAIMTVQAYIASAGDVQKFRQALKWRMVAWLWTLPAGVGMATGRSIFKMMLGFSNTGVYSAGNGGAMRSAVLGILCTDVEQLKQFVHISTTLTHTDPKAYQGALLVALLAWIECYHQDWTIEQVFDFLNQHIDDKQLIDLIIHYQTNQNGITGYMYHTVPAVANTWINYRHQPIAGFHHLIQQGGDTDSTCAIFGGIVGVRYGEQIYDEIQGKYCEPKITTTWLKQLSQQAYDVYQHNISQKPLYLFGILTYPRNIIFLMIVLLHGFRRLLPPY